MTRDPRRLLGGWATDTLTEAERRDLLRAALDDQALFDALLQEDGLRDLLGDPAARQQVLAALERPTRGERLRAWLARPATVADLGAIAALLVVAFVGYNLLRGPGGAPRPAVARPGSALSPASIARLAALPARDTGAARLETEGGTVVATVRSPARVLLIDRRPDGSAAQAWPPAGRAPASVSPASADRPARVGLAPIALSPPGPHRLRLVVAPLDLDLGALTPAAIEDAAGRLTLLDRPYEVAHP